MTENIKQPWILAGYKVFSEEGLSGLKVEIIARKIDKSKSSFYHLFGDVDCFLENLFDYHLERTKIIANKEKLCKNIVPELLNLLLEVKQDLLFHRQLRVNRHLPDYKKCFEVAHQQVEDAIIDVWASMLELSEKKYVARIIFELTIENFYLQITEDSLTFEWLLSYVNKLRFMVEEIKMRS